MLGIENIMKKKQIELNTDESPQMRFARNHVHFLHGEINEENMSKAYEWLIYENLDPVPKTLTLYVNTTGGNLYEAFGFIDLMTNSHHTIQTVGIGNVMSSGFLIFISGTKNYRFIGKHSSILCHQHSNEIDGKYHDIKSHIKENHNCFDRMMNVIAKNSKLDSTEITQKLLSPTDNWMTSEEIITYGLADYIL
jgi:ATP-dependent Clp protease protease subunit